MLGVKWLSKSCILSWLGLGFVLFTSVFSWKCDVEVQVMLSVTDAVLAHVTCILRIILAEVSLIS